MKIIKLIYFKYIFSFSICVFSSFIVFFIFSLIGNLNEDYLFNDILKISLYGSLQIITYVPVFIFLLSVILLLIFLRSKNEMIVIKSYINEKKLFIFFAPIVLVFSVLEINKNYLSLEIENIKNNLINKNNILTTKILLEKNKNFKNFTVFNNIDFSKIEDAEYRFYRVIDNKIVEAEFSDDLQVVKDDIIAKSYTTYKDNVLKNLNKEKLFQIDILEIINQDTIVKDLSRKNTLFIINSFNLLLFSILFFTYIFLIFFSRGYVNIKQSLIPPIFISLSFIIYSFLIFNSSLSVYKQIFELLACLIICMLILKFKFNE